MEAQIKKIQEEQTKQERKEATERNKRKREERLRKIEDTDGIKRRVQRVRVPIVMVFIEECNYKTIHKESE